MDATPTPQWDHSIIHRHFAGKLYFSMERYLMNRCFLRDIPQYTTTVWRCLTTNRQRPQAQDTGTAFPDVTSCTPLCSRSGCLRGFSQWRALLLPALHLDLLPPVPPPPPGGGFGRDMPAALAAGAHPLSRVMPSVCLPLRRPTLRCLAEEPPHRPQCDGASKSRGDV